MNETNRDERELKMVKAQVALALKQSQTEFWKVLIAAVAATAVVTGVLVRWFAGV